VAHQLFQVGQKALIERDGRVLVMFFPNGGLDLPGGRIDQGESDLNAALLREIREETSLEIEIGPPFSTWISVGGRVYVVVFRCRYVSGEVVLSHEHGAYRWINAGSYRELADGSRAYQAVQAYFESRSAGARSL
jgi:8-oxo-dGTP pyrophosphatase MutT (NUDIX family)